LIEEQQKELSTFLTPYQRARFLGGREMIMGAVIGRGGGGRGGRMGGGGRLNGPPPDGSVREQRRPGNGGGGQPDVCAGPRPGARGRGTQ
jgi:hypothetical protein